MTTAVLAVFTVALVGWVVRPLFVPVAVGSGPPRCPTCGERPEGDARYCSNCGKPTTR